MNNPSHQASICPVCSRPGELKLDFPQSPHGYRFSLHICKTCNLCYTSPMPSNELLKKIYTGEYWIREETVQKGGFVARMVSKYNRIRFAATVRPLMRRLPSGASVLEVGCGSGQLAIYLKRQGYNVEVTDISQDILDEIKELYDIKGYCGSLEEINFSHSYDSLIFNNVLEHLPDPLRALQKAEQLLTPQGLIFLEVPNIDSLQLRLFKGSWFPLQIPQHLFHFSPESLQKITVLSSLERIWQSTFSPRISAAGYVASIFPFLQPDKIRQSWSMAHLFLYLGLQLLFLPLAFLEALAYKGSAVRAIYRKIN